VKFDMASATLSTLATDTRTSHHDLGALVTDLVRCVEPLQGSFHGQGRAAFDRFKGRADEVAAELNANRALAQKLDINGTPSFILEEEMLRGYVPLARMQELVTSVRAQ